MERTAWAEQPDRKVLRRMSEEMDTVLIDGPDEYTVLIDGPEEEDEDEEAEVGVVARDSVAGSGRR